MYKACLAGLSGQQLPPHIVAALSTPSADSWAAITSWLDDGQTTELIRLAKQRLGAWPKELPRPAPKRWLATAHQALYKPTLGLCLDVKEVDTYPFYIAALSSEPRLKLRDGSDAVSLHRQQRGVVETSTGKKVAMNGDVPGMADLGGTLTVEWGGGACDCFTYPTIPHLSVCALKQPPSRIQLYIEIEVKLDGKIPPQAKEYTGTSRRQLTDTERQQVQRQQAQLARGGCYIFADRVVDAVEAVVRYRDEVLARIGA